MADQTPEPPKGLVFQWSNKDQLPIVFADFMHWRAATDRFYLTIGQTSVPVLPGVLPDGLEIDVHTLVRFAITTETLKIWAQMLNAAVAEIIPSEVQE